MSIAQNTLHFYKNIERLDGVELRTAIINADEHIKEELDADYEVNTCTYADGSCITMSDDYIGAYGCELEAGE